MIPDTLAEHPEPQLVGVATRDLQKPVVVHAIGFESILPLFPQRVRDETSVVYNASPFLRSFLQKSARLRTEFDWFVWYGQLFAYVRQLVPDCFVFGRGAIRPGVVFQMLFEVYEHRGFRVEGSLQTVERNPLVQTV